MTTHPAYLVATHPAHFRSGHLARIVGVVFVTPPGKEPRPCFDLEYADGVRDQLPCSNDMEHWRFVSGESVRWTEHKDKKANQP